MLKGKILWIGFAAMVLIQLAVLIKMISSNNIILNKGEELYFKVQPIDPEDPFRGRYITLRFESISFKTTKEDNTFIIGDLVYITFTTDQYGMAQIDEMSFEIPETTSYLEVPINYISDNQAGDSLTIEVEYPFNRLYLEESKAPMAEALYLEASSDGDIEIYALVSVFNGTGLVTSVYIDGVPIEIAVEDRIKNEEPFY